MLPLTIDFKNKVIAAILESRTNYSGSDKSFSKSLGINNASYSRLKNGETEKILSDGVWLTLARELKVQTKKTTWNTAKTVVYKNLENSFNFCKEYNKSMILTDDCGIGKTHCSQVIVKNMKDSFYVDCSQGKSRIQFIRMLARTIGLDTGGRYVDLKNNIKYYINNVLQDSFFVLDDAGYLDYPAFLEVLEMWNGTSGRAGWYMMGDESFQQKITRGINSKKIGYKAIFSRFQNECIHITPVESESRRQFRSDLYKAVSIVNLDDKSLIPKIVKQCLSKDADLRYVRTLIELNKDEQSPNS